jgi:hypothetical protein
MWLPSPPGEGETLRQGDLLRGLLLPKLSVPLNYARGPDDPVMPEHPVVVQQMKPSDFLVVSQCCTIEQSGVVALAPIRSTPPLKPDEKTAYHKDEPDSGISGYVIAHHRIDGVADLQPKDGRLQIADLTLIQTYQGKVADFQRARRAAMTPAGRRLLRIRLGLFWARVEQEDLKWFEAQSLPPNAVSNG